ncbi:hypothetical protein HS088_TW04G01580 [Tripterygium wilfordii]|uniref:Uncharacterized protein n=1 Tax=Tripterygium wilfordii TaxID=458696 RepID=A0A7J7DTC2_TRIWF|nr:hypothetical protein HS088_TW04G01580 [Tripterygium wilfordii]
MHRAKHKYAEKLLQEVDGYETTGIGDRSKLLDKADTLNNEPLAWLRSLDEQEEPSAWLRSLDEQ